MSPAQVGVGLSQEADTATAVRRAVHDAMDEAGLARAAWALCFFSSDHLRSADVVRRTVLELTGCDALCGCSAHGVIGRGQEVQGRPGVAVMVGTCPSVEAHSRMLPEDLYGLADLRADLSAVPGGAAAAIVLPDSFRVDNTVLQQRLAQELAPIASYGAGATDDGTRGLSVQVGVEGVRSGTVAMLGLGGEYECGVGVTQSCTVVGEPHFITEARDFTLIELDGRSALETFIEQGRALGLDDMQQAVQELLFGFPLDTEAPEFTGDACLVRPLAGFDQATHGLVIPYPLQTHTTMGFMHRNPENAERDMTRMVRQAAAGLSGRPDFGVYFDCAARGRGLYGREGVDVDAIHEHFGPFPLIGMFGGFELATVQRLPHVYTYTGVLVLVRARDGSDAASADTLV